MAQIMRRKKGYLALASGRIFEGALFGAPADFNKAGGEVVFNTSMTGYQEILTDPSYQGQIVVMTASHIGNTGINREDIESRKIFLSGFVVQELSPNFSNWRSNQDLNHYLEKAGVPGLTGVDTRALTRFLRTQGAVNGVLGSADPSTDDLIKRAKSLPSLEGLDLVKKVTTQSPYPWIKGSGPWKSFGLHAGQKNNGPSSGRKKNVVVMDFGVKQNILRCLVDLNCEVTVVPAHTSSSEILEHKPDGVLLSNGPGDPAMVHYGIETIKELVAYNQTRKEKAEQGFTLFGICLGHQLLGQALGGKTHKLKFGHHGANHPIQDLETGKVEITSQNHGFGVEGEKSKEGNWTLKGNPAVQVTHLNLNDQTVEGLKHNTLPIFSIQYHPEASAGPHDSRYLFERFMKAMDLN